MHVLVEMGMKLAQVEYVVFDEADRYVSMSCLEILAMRSLVAASRPRLSEKEPKWLVFETYCYAFGGRIRRCDFFFNFQRRF